MAAAPASSYFKRVWSQDERQTMKNIWKMKNKDSPERYLYLANNEYHDVRNHCLVQLSAGRKTNMAS
jgi:uncharacterized protein YukJ